MKQYEKQKKEAGAVYLINIINFRFSYKLLAFIVDVYFEFTYRYNKLTISAPSYLDKSICQRLI